MPKLLIVDDEPNVLYSFDRAFAQDQIEIRCVETGADAVDAVDADRPDAVVLDVRLPDMSGLDVFEQIQSLDARLPVIFVTAHSTTDTAINAMKRGAFEYLLKPVDIHELRELVHKALEISRLRHVPAVFESEASGPAGVDQIVGRSKPMQEVYKTVGRVAPEDVTVLILGESGTGKELIARAIYHHSERSNKPFLAINCAALPETLLESELFGHERGAFTGAERRRIGKFEQADGGTLFLDELGDMSPATQAKVLRILQDGRFERVGGNETIPTDVRVIAATNQDLETRITRGEFRQDLLYRLNGFTIRLPPLRERLEDLPLLIDHFLTQAQQEAGRPTLQLANETLALLESYNWPGNVRELQSVIKYAVVHAVGDVITPECLPDACRGRSLDEGNADAIDAELAGVASLVRRMLRAEEPDVYRRLLAHVDRITLRETLRHVQGNQVHASRRLGVSRSTLRSKLQHIDESSELS
jgi:nitrogen regulation protein NR(I)